MSLPFRRLRTLTLETDRGINKLSDYEFYQWKKLRFVDNANK